MFSTYRRHGLIVVLLALTGLGGVAVGAPERVPPLPSVEALVARSGWSLDRRQSQPICFAARPSFNTAVCVVHDRRGQQAQLYVGAESVQKMVHWSGELGFAGAGYQTSERTATTVRLPNGTMVPTSGAIEQRLTDRVLEEYAVVAPGYIAAHSTDHLLRDAWDVARGRSGPYFVVRVVVPSPVPASDQRARATAAELLAPVLLRLSRIAQVS